MINALSLDSNSINLIKSVLDADKRIKSSSVSITHIGNPSLSVQMHFNTPEECASNLLLNGAHRVIMLHSDGEMVNLMGYKTAKFRQGKVKSVDEFADKLRKYLVKALEVA